MWKRRLRISASDVLKDIGSVAVLLVEFPTTSPCLVWVCFGFTRFSQNCGKQNISFSYSAFEKCCLVTEMTLRLHFYAIFYNIIAVMWALNAASERFMNQLNFSMLQSVDVNVAGCFCCFTPEHKSEVIIILKPTKCSTIRIISKRAWEHNELWAWARAWEGERKSKKKWSTIHSN